MTIQQACNFLLLGLGMIAGPAVWPEYFVVNQMRSAIWLVLMGGLQAAGASLFLLFEGVRGVHRLAVWVEESLDCTVSLADVHRAALPASFYALIEEAAEEVARAQRLPHQLLLAV